MPTEEQYQRAARTCVATAADLRAFVEGAGVDLDTAVRLSAIGITRPAFDNWKRTTRG